MDMQFHWVPDCVAQGQLEIRWEPGDSNHADYYTKHHPTTHHMKVRPNYLHSSHLALLTTQLRQALAFPDPDNCQHI